MTLDQHALRAAAADREPRTHDDRFDFQPRTRVIFGAGALARVGGLAKELGFRRTLLVADAGVVRAGYVAAAIGALEAAGIEAVVFHDFGQNPDSAMVEAGRVFCAPLGIDSMIGLGGGSSLDCAKGINFLLTNRWANGRLPWIRQGEDAAPSDDWRADDGRHRKRGAELCRHFRRVDAYEDGVRRSVGRGENRDSGSGPHDERAGRRDGHGRIRRDRARCRNMGDVAPDTVLGHVRPAGVGMFEHGVRTGARAASRPRFARIDAPRLALRRHRHRAVDARCRTCSPTH